MQQLAIFKCPVCQEPLQVHPTFWRCVNLHSFDVAKSGYVNLILPNKKNSADPGDSKEMVEARCKFFGKGYYAHFSEALNRFVMESCSQSLPKPLQILDVGCGEGYFLQNLKNEIVRGADAVPMHFCGMDVSKNAIQKAAKKDHSITWCVGNVFDLPIVGQTQDILINIFSPYSFEEFRRVLKPPSGLAIFAVQGEDHLLELRQLIYENAVASESQQRFLNKIESFKGFRFEKQTAIRQKIHLNSQEDIERLIRMTPYYWHLSAPVQQKIKELRELEVTTHMEVFAFSLK